MNFDSNRSWNIVDPQIDTDRAFKPYIADIKHAKYMQW